MVFTLAAQHAPCRFDAPPCVNEVHEVHEVFAILFFTFATIFSPPFPPSVYTVPRD